MDTIQLKSLAGRVRDLLQQHSSVVGHNQSLDLIAALPGLRSWPEVIAFPERVAATNVDTISVGRLAFRIKRNFKRELPLEQLMATLLDDEPQHRRAPLAVWPSGPRPGVYVTKSPAAIDALVGRYEEATDGGLIYAEHPDSKWEGVLDLGENGLWSSGIDRLPTGTLLIVGPLRLDQENWQDAAERVEMACWHALNSEHRAAILIDTPTPGLLHQDMITLARTVRPERDAEAAFVGSVTEAGELQLCRPFAPPYPQISNTPTIASLDVFSSEALNVLENQIKDSQTGILVFGSPVFTHSELEMVAAALRLTDTAGPAARIMPRHRGTPEKDWQVPQPIAALPFLPSIASAYAQGYRRMVVDPHYSREEMVNYPDVLFLVGTFGHTAADIALRIGLSGRDEWALLNRTLVIIGTLRLKGKNGELIVSDLFVSRDQRVPDGATYEQAIEFINSHRALRWEEQLTHLIESRQVSASGIKKVVRNDHAILEFLASHKKTGVRT